MKKNTYIWMLVLALTIAGIFYFAKAGSSLALDATVKDMGDVSQANGIISTDFLMTNKGNKDIVINRMSTSCMCTTAQVINGGKEGPKYGMDMHGNPKGWSTVIAPGGTATLRVFYDPNMHKDLKGPVTRVVSIFTSAGTLNANIRLNQIP